MSFRKQTLGAILKDKRLFMQFVDWWIDNLPDISEMPDIRAENVQFWLKQKKKSRHKPHRQFPGLCAQWCNASVDKAISMNLWPVRFKDAKGRKNELVTEFSVGMWAQYCALMDGKPKPHSNVCQIVLKYILLNPECAAKAWRTRLYYYSSGTLFKQVSGDLKDFLKDAKDNIIPMKAKLLRNVSCHTEMST